MPVSAPPPRPALWAPLVTEGEWRALTPSLAADPSLQDDLAGLLGELGPRARRRFIVHLLSHLLAHVDDRPLPVRAVAPALESLLRESRQAGLACSSPQPAGGTA